jgi:hypothetical protein
MNKKVYQKPSTEVVEFHQNLQLLTGSGVGAKVRSYGSAVTGSWENSEDETNLSSEELSLYLSLLSILN